MANKTVQDWMDATSTEAHDLEEKAIVRDLAGSKVLHES